MTINHELYIYIALLFPKQGQERGELDGPNQLHVDANGKQEVLNKEA